GHLYRLDTDRTVATVLSDVTISNGLAWSTERDEAIYVDSPTQRIDRLEFDPVAGTFEERRPWVTIDADDGMPDGIALDADGGVWVGLWGGGAVRHYGADGSLDEVIEVPVRNVTACALADGDLFITTSAVDDPDNAIAGAVFHAPVGVAAAPLGAFAG
ncbi:MAG: SMP-30/gluconolactonase/LRE family protein, partial [Acidimicrobiales bacterium]